MPKAVTDSARGDFGVSETAVIRMFSSTGMLYMSRLQHCERHYCFARAAGLADDRESDAGILDYFLRFTGSAPHSRRPATFARSRAGTLGRHLGPVPGCERNLRRPARSCWQFRAADLTGRQVVFAIRRVVLQPEFELVPPRHRDLQQDERNVARERALCGLIQAVCAGRPVLAAHLCRTAQRHFAEVNTVSSRTAQQPRSRLNAVSRWRTE